MFYNILYIAHYIYIQFIYVSLALNLDHPFSWGPALTCQTGAWEGFRVPVGLHKQTALNLPALTQLSSQQAHREL